MGEEYLTWTAGELARKIQKGEIRPSEAVEASLLQIERMEPQIGAFLQIDREGALARAEEVEQGIRSGKYQGPFAGVPAAVKDNICTKGMETTCASRILSGFYPPYDACAVEKLKEAGIIILGKTNMDEFAMGSTTETSARKVTKNPWNTGHVPGGSSGGSCAAVAADECFIALGSDTGGSIRQPSSFCGVTGIKPTYGTVSRYGLIAYASSLDQIGPIGKDVADCARMLSLLAGQDRRDSTSLKRETLDFEEDLAGDIRGMKVGIPKEYLDEGIAPEVRDALKKTMEILKERGASVEEFSLGMTEYVIPSYYIIASAEASSNLARFDGVKYGYRSPHADSLHEMYKMTRSEGFGTEVKRRIFLGSFVLSSGYYDAYYLKALKARAVIKEAFDRAFAAYDVLLGPAAPQTAPKIGESLSDPLQMYLGDLYTAAVNLAGLPAISVPCTVSKTGLPIGIQLIGDCLQEKKIIRAAAAFEKERGIFPKAYSGTKRGKI